VHVYGMDSKLLVDDIDEMALWQRVRYHSIEREVLLVVDTDHLETVVDDRLLMSIFEQIFAYEHADLILGVELGWLVTRDLIESVQGHAVAELYMRNAAVIAMTRLGFERIARPWLNGTRGFSRETPAPRADTANLPLPPEINGQSELGCRIRVREELIFGPLLTGLKSVPGEAIKIAFLVPSKNVAVSWPEAPVITNLLSSLCRTLTAVEKFRFRITVYVGFDRGDPLYEQKGAAGLVNDYVRSQGCIIDVKLVRLPRTRWLTLIWSRLYVQAVAEGNEAFLQVNDDVQIIASPGWLTSVTDALQRHPVVGLNDVLWDCKLFTHAAVSRAHYERFRGHMYPLALSNWYSDTWLTFVYGSRAGCLREAKVSNPAGTRYQRCNLSNDQFIDLLRRTEPMALAAVPDRN
jgi:hypothetical protein